MSCNSCEDLRTNSPTFYQKGVTTAVCNSLKNDTGFSTSNNHNDCTDLGHANDCLIGDMATEIKSYGVCDWRKFTRKFIGNVHQVIKAIICAICGILTRLTKVECEVKYLFEGASFSFGEDTEGKDSVLVPGKGVDFSLRSSSEVHSSDVTLTYIAGGLMSLSGSLRTFHMDFAEKGGTTRQGNSMWNFDNAEDNFNPLKGGEMLYEIRIKKSEYPQISRIFSGHAFQTGGMNADFLVRIASWDGDKKVDGQSVDVYAFGQHGWCDDDGTPSESGYSSGHKVPSGWIYVQARMMMVQRLPMGSHKDGAGVSRQSADFTPMGYVGVRMARGGIGC